jgi:hypothetical protein
VKCEKRGRFFGWRLKRKRERTEEREKGDEQKEGAF